MEAPVAFKYILKYVSNSNYFESVQSGEMNKCTLFLVFVCGVVFAGLVSILKISIDIDPLVKKFYPAIGMLPPLVDLEIMDDGYVAMAQLDSYFAEKDIVARTTKATNIKAKGTDLEERSSELEALNSLKAAVELAAAGKNARALRLLEHAHSLAPYHHDVLLTYGEYLEEHREDIIQADHMFLKALTFSPSSSRALRNRMRTQAIVEKIDASLLTRIDNKRDELALIPSLSGALRRIKREAYFQHIYHTAAIEGNTLTLAQIRMVLETGLSVGGKSVMEHNEILGIDLALKYINTTLVHRIGKITLRDILEIHRRVLGHVDPIEAGTMRTTQVFVSDHVPPPPSKIEILMEGFMLWLNSGEAQKLHPIKYAALAHYKLVFIHPFVDGNGRTARLLMNFLLMQAGYPPVIIRKQDRLRYYEYLQTANDGDTRPFIRFVARCLEKTLDVYLWATKEHLPEIEQETHPSNNLGEGDRVTMTTPKISPVAFLTDIAGDGGPSMTVNPDSNGFTFDDTVYEVNSLHSKFAGMKYDEYDDDDSGHGSSVSSEWLSDSESNGVLERGRFRRVADENGKYNAMKNIKNLQSVLTKEEPEKVSVSTGHEIV